MKRHATAHWEGSLGDGKGTIDTQSGALSSHGYSFKARFEDESGKSGTNPEELIAAAHASCFTMALSFKLAEAGHTDGTLTTSSTVTLEKDDSGFTVTKSELTTKGKVPGLAPETFYKLAEEAKAGCPISKLLNCEITLSTRFEG